jgi:hypothetical protein
MNVVGFLADIAMDQACLHRSSPDDAARAIRGESAPTPARSGWFRRATSRSRSYTATNASTATALASGSLGGRQLASGVRARVRRAVLVSQARLAHVILGCSGWSARLNGWGSGGWKKCYPRLGSANVLWREPHAPHLVRRDKRRSTRYMGRSARYISWSGGITGTRKPGRQGSSSTFARRVVHAAGAGRALDSRDQRRPEHAGYLGTLPCGLARRRW